MATPEDLSRLNAHLRPLAGVVHAAAVADGGPWVAAVLDARYTDGDGGFIHKTRVERADGSTGGPSLPVEGSLELIALGQARPTGQDRWHGLVLRVTPEGACEVRFNYDPACAEDGGFFES
jgi:hypothetical protein